MRVREDDRGEGWSRGAADVELRDIAQDAALQQLHCMHLRRPERVVVAALVVELHSEVKEHARAVLRGDLNADAADLASAAVNQVLHRGLSRVL